MPTALSHILWRVLRLVVALGLAVSLTAHAAPKPKKQPAKKSLVKRVVAHLKAPPSSKAPAPTAAVERLGRGYKLYLDGQYEAAKKELRALDPKQMQNADYVLYLLAQSELLVGRAQGGARAFSRADADAVALLDGGAAGASPIATGTRATSRARAKATRRCCRRRTISVEPAVARFRIGEALAKKGALPAAQQQWRKVYVGEPMHPLAEEALARLTESKAPPITPEERIARAKTLTKNRAWPRALEELALVPADVPQAVRDEADYWIGTTKFHMRRDYDIAAQKLLGVWQRLPTRSARSTRCFTARAPGRAPTRTTRRKRDIASCCSDIRARRSRPEASFLIGWLDFNRGKYKEAIPGLEETLKRYGGSAFGDDARWYLGFSRWLSGDFAGALGDFEMLAKMSGALSGGKGAYWRGRALAAQARRRGQGGLARAGQRISVLVLRAAGARAAKERGVELGPFGDGSHGTAPPLADLDVKLANDPLIMRVDELLLAGPHRRGGRRAAARRARVHQALRRGARAAAALRSLRARRQLQPSAPARRVVLRRRAARSIRNSDANARKWWEMVYPRAYRAVHREVFTDGENPPYYLYTIMQKESAYNPHDVSYADAIGLLQMIPPTSRRVALRIDAPYTDDVLYDPEGNIRFGAWYIGHLLQKFKGRSRSAPAATTRGRAR